MTRQNCKNCGEPYSFDNLVTPGRATMICAACSKKIYTHTGQMYFEAPLHQKNHAPTPISLGQGVSFVPFKDKHSTEPIAPASRPHADLPKSEGWQRAKTGSPSSLVEEVQVVTEKTEVHILPEAERTTKPAPTLNGAEKTLYYTFQILSILLLGSFVYFIVADFAHFSIRDFFFMLIGTFFLSLLGPVLACVYKKVSLLSKK